MTQHYRGFLLNQTFVDFRQKIKDTAVHYSRMMAQKNIKLGPRIPFIFGGFVLFIKMAKDYYVALLILVKRKL